MITFSYRGITTFHEGNMLNCIFVNIQIHTYKGKLNNIQNYSLYMIHDFYELRIQIIFI